MWAQKSCPAATTAAPVPAGAAVTCAMQTVTKSNVRGDEFGAEFPPKNSCKNSPQPLVSGLEETVPVSSPYLPLARALPAPLRAQYVPYAEERARGAHPRLAGLSCHRAVC